MRTHISLTAFVGLVTCFAALPAHSQDLTILQNDLVLGLSRSDPIATLEIIRGPASFEGGEWEDSPWEQPFVQAVQFDNSGGISHNPAGVLLGVNYGSNDATGEIYSLPTCVAQQAGQLIGDTVGTGGGGLTLSNLSGISVSPDNTKVAINGYDTGAVIVFDYTAGDCTGAGTSLSGARETGEVLRAFGSQGTTWLDNDTVIAFSANGELVSVDATTMSSQVLASVNTGREPTSFFSAVEYNALISPYVYASYSTFLLADGTINSLYVFDPRNGFELVASLDNSTSMNTAREIALDAAGNLYLGQFGANIDVLLNVLDPTSLQDNQTIDWYIAQTSASFSGLDIAVALPIGDVQLRGDFNGDGLLDAEDIDDLTVQSASGTNPAAYDLNDDGLVNADDVKEWIRADDIYYSWVGDANLDKVFDTNDLIDVLAAATYEVEVEAVWSTGDFNGNGRFASGDLIDALADGGYELGPRTGVASVPEPMALALVTLGVLISVGCLRRHGV